MLHGFSNINISWFPPTTSVFSLFFKYNIQSWFVKGFWVAAGSKCLFFNEKFSWNAHFWCTIANRCLPWNINGAVQIESGFINHRSAFIYSCNCCNLCFPMHKQGKRPRVATTTCKCVFCYTQTTKMGSWTTFLKGPSQDSYIIHTTNSFSGFHKFF